MNTEQRRLFNHINDTFKPLCVEKQSQNEQILAFMRRHGEISIYDTCNSPEYGKDRLMIPHLPRRILDLKQRGHSISTVEEARVVNGRKRARVAYYRLEEGE